MNERRTWQLTTPGWPAQEPEVLLANVVLLVRMRFGADWPVLLCRTTGVERVTPAVDLEHDPMLALATVPPVPVGPGVAGAVAVCAPGVDPPHGAVSALWPRANGLSGWTRLDAGDPALGEHVGVVLRAWSTTPDTATGAVSVLTEEDRRLLLRDWNAPACTYPDVTLHGLFRARVTQQPDAEALRAAGRTVSYAALDRASDERAARLTPLVRTPGALVVLSGLRSVELFTWILAVLKAGAGYVFLDPGLPQARARTLVELTDPVAVLATDSGHPVARALMVRPEAVDRVAAVEARPDTTAYVLFTSGSTGVPKGVLRPHRMHTSRIALEQRMYGLGPGDRVLLKSEISFREFFWPLSAGATCVLSEPGRERDDRYLAELIDEEAITVVSFVPSMLRLLLTQPAFRTARALRHVFAGGEALDPAVEDALRALGYEVHNTYTLSEADYVCHRPGPVRSEPSDGSHATTVGTPLDMRIYLCDEAGRLVPPGVVGEIYTGGPGLADGYLGRPDLTAERFVANTVDPDGPPILFRTGDLARFRPDGQVLYLGRVDAQVKVRGQRVEPAEVEAALRDHPAIADAAVVGIADRDQGAVLAGYVVLGDGGAPRTDELRAYLRERLPDYMVPAYLAAVPSLPLLDSGKVDRSRLAVVSRSRPTLTQPVTAPVGPAQRRAVALVGQLLGLDTIGVDDDFFDLGGDSLRLMLLRGALEAETGGRVELADVLTARTPRLLARLLAPAGPPPAAAEDDGGARAAMLGRAVRQRRGAL